MKITICGSIAFIEDMQALKQRLEAAGHQVQIPPDEVFGPDGQPMPVAAYYHARKRAKEEDTWIWERKAQAMRLHFEKIAASDAILVLNPSKNGVEGYVGCNTLIEIGLAFFLRKKIYLLHPPGPQPCLEEILGIQPTLLQANLAPLNP